MSKKQKINKGNTKEFEILENGEDEDEQLLTVNPKNRTNK